MTDQEKQEYAANYHFGWIAHALGVPYRGMHSEAQRAGHAERWLALMPGGVLHGVPIPEYVPDLSIWAEALAEVANA